MFRARSALLLVCAIASLALSQFAGALEPKTYTSRSGQYALTIDPGQRNGAGSARYALQKGPVTAWSAELPFTLWDAVVADDGVVGGYAYTTGYDHDDGEFVVAIIDGKGKVRTSERTPRRPSPYLHTLGDPKAAGVLLDADNDRFVVRVADADINAQSEAWWTYRLSDGHLLAKPKPKALAGDEHFLRYVMAAQPIVGTPLTLVQWLRSACCTSESDDFGTAFEIVDADAKPVWMLALPRDYVAAERDPKDRIMSYMREHGAILDATQPMRFDVWQVVDAARVSYVVERDASGTWRARETGRKAQSAVPTDSPQVHHEAQEHADLPLVGTIRLETGVRSPAVIYDVFDFSIADRGRFAFVNGCGCTDATGPATLTIVDGTGRLLRSILLPPIDGPHEGWAHYHQAWLGGDRWVVTRSLSGIDTHSAAFIVDGGTGSVSRPEAFDTPQIDSLASSRDGGFIAVTNAQQKYGMTSGLSAFDADGRLRWSVGEAHGDEAKLSGSVEAVAVTTTGDVVVLQNVSNNLKIYDRSGAYQRTLDLAPVFAGKLEYPRGIEADAAGGVIVQDANKDVSFVQMKLDGTRIRALTPVFADGRRFETRGGIQASSDGSLWTSDGSSLLRLDTRGVVQAVVGERPDADALGRVAAIAVRSNGWIYAADHRTAAVHVFDGTGKRVQVCRPDTKDYDAELELPSLTVTDGGDVFITRRDGFSEEGVDFLHYSPSCTRLGIETAAVDATSQTWHAQPGSTHRWIHGFGRLYLVDARGQTVRTIERQANGRWLDADAAATAPDGSIAVVSNQPDAPAVPESVTVYTRGGDAVDTWPLPAKSYLASIAYDGRTIAWLTNEREAEQRISVTLLDTRNGTRRQFTPPSATEGSAVFLEQRNGADELWIFDGRSTINRYALR